MAQDFTNRDVNRPYWPGPNAAGMGKATKPPVQAGADTAGMHDTIWNGLNAIGTPKNNPGGNTIGQIEFPNQA